MDFKDIIKAHLDKMASQDFAFAERYKLGSKNLDDCVKYIISQAQKKKSGNCAAIEDAVVYGWAVHYYMEDKVKANPVKEKVKVVTPKVETPKADIKPIKAIVKDRKNNNKCVELDLFGGF